ncbi:fungal-specific transcription factor domain-containing protein [Phaeosphaeriaceae sp. PMI808]|nr:fungal-specific transcription factor domain-containing protein [Phaeosphaeriaceae sp. PMI808]
MTTNTTSTPTPSSSTSRRVPLDKRKRTETSCDKCKSRKQKCRKEPGQEACRYCVVHNIECLTTQPRKKRLYGSVEGLGNRLTLLESLVKGLRPETDVSNMDELRDLAFSLGIALPESVVEGGNGEPKSGSSDREGDDSLSLLPDQQGQVQYIGPASSFSFHLKLRTLVGRGGKREFVLFGRNAAEPEPVAEDSMSMALLTPSTTSNHDQDPNHIITTTTTTNSNNNINSPADRRTSLPDTGITPSTGLESLISAFFDHINNDFPVMHEASFREAYEGWLAAPASADPAWLCSFLCVLLLARRVARVNFPEDQERLWWRRVQTLLPVVIFTSSVMAVQAMMLAAMHLHNTNHRDACWNLTGTAVRIAHAIGLHQDKVSTLQTPLARELRKRLWWTLYAFEQMQVSSYDRPSAIEHPGSKISCPNERIIGMAAYCPPDYSKSFNRLVVHLASACRAPKTIRAKSSEESYVGPLSPAAGVLRDMERWQGTLPQHLRMDALNTAPPAFQRPLLLLHGMYHYTVTVLCRAALLARASILSKAGKDSPNVALTAMADSCSESGRALGQIILQLDSIGKFDAITWWDVWYALAAGSVLVLDLVCLNKTVGTDVSDSRIILSQLADLALRHKQNPYMPGTIEKFASIIPDLHSMADSLSASKATVIERKPEENANGNPGHHCPPAHQQEIGPFPYHQSSTNSGAYMFADNVPGHFYPEQNHPSEAYPNTRFDRNTQMNFMDFTIHNINDWNWGDLGNLIGNEAVPNIHSHMHPPPGHPPPSGPG